MRPHRWFTSACFWVEFSSVVANTNYQWLQFSFFDVVPVKDAHDLASPPEIFKV